MPKIKPPTEFQLQKLNELKSLVESYRLEISPGRGAWPKVIRDRVSELAMTRMSYRQISSFTNIPYDTIVAWPVRKVFNESDFRELSVTQGGQGNLESASSLNFGVAVTTPTTLTEVNIGQSLEIVYRGIEVKNLKLSEVTELLFVILKLEAT